MKTRFTIKRTKPSDATPHGPATLTLQDADGVWLSLRPIEIGNEADGSPIFSASGFADVQSQPIIDRVRALVGLDLDGVTLVEVGEVD